MNRCPALSCNPILHMHACKPEPPELHSCCYCSILFSGELVGAPKRAH